MTTNTERKPVDVLAVFAKLIRFGHSGRNPFATSTLRSHLRRSGITTAQTRAALVRAEREGLVVRVPDPMPRWTPSAADRAEIHWRLTDLGVAHCEALIAREAA